MEEASGGTGRARYALGVVLLAISIASCSADESSGGDGGRSGGASAIPGGIASQSGGGSSGASGAGGDGIFGQQPVNPAAGGGAGAPGASGSGPENCAEAMVQASRSPALIEFVIDGSGSMCENFGGSTRWQALRTALLEPTNGLIYRLQEVVIFGSVIYDGTIDAFLALAGAGSTPTPACATNYLQAKAMGECPLLQDVPPAYNNAMAIDMGFPQTELGGSTPTDQALTWTIDRLLEQRTTQPDQEQVPQYIILATDGAPNDICFGSPTANLPDVVAQNVLAQADRAAQANIKIFVISLAGNDPQLQAHLDEVARRGDPGNPAAVTYTPESPEELTNTLAALVGGAVGCEVFLNGKVTPGRECSGFVESLGNRLPCCTPSGGGWTCGDMQMAEPNGWVLKDESTVELVGNACTDFLSSVDIMLRAGFPCDVFTPD